ncbi:MAG: preprotein translocase subunit SecE [Candidatus Moranbacteria bacterium]|nr:preprotein translocase subunit SecE [Candidatus Moranbacteria bacterium]
MFSKIVKFIGEAKVELFKVNWPTKKQTINYTVIILGISLFMAIFLGGLDYLFAEILKIFIVG